MMPLQFRTYSTNMQITAATENEDDVVKLFRAVCGFLRRIGFVVTKDPRIDRDYKTLNKFHRYGRHSDLEVLIERGRRVSLEFFQNIVIENKNGGQYDFDKLEKMPYLVKLRFQLTIMKTKAFLESRGFTEKREFRSYHENPLGMFHQSWNFPGDVKSGKNRFGGDDGGWPTADELKYWNQKDANGNVITNGRSGFILVNGRATRCVCYGGINGMWHCIFGVFGDRQENSSSIYSVFPGRGRIFRDRHRADQLKRAMKKAVESEDFLRAHAIKSFIIRRSVAALECAT